MIDYKEIFAFNLRKLRKQANLTQDQLAEKLHYSEKSVSKWEKGFSVPPANVLFEIAEIFGTGLDELFDRPSNELYYLGIDGGGTKTAFCLIDSNKNIIKRMEYGPSNPFDIKIENTIGLLDQGIKEISVGISHKNIKVFVGIAGSRSGNFAAQIDGFLDSCHFSSFKSGSDIDITVDAVLGKEDGIAVIMGTGHVVIPRINGKTSMIGGLGYLFDMGGSGYDFGLQAIRAAILSEEGVYEDTVLRKLILEKTGGNNVREHLLELYRQGKSGIARFAPVLFDAIKENDAVANRILRSNMYHVAEQINAAVKKFDGNRRIKTVICGGLCKDKDIILPSLKTEIEKFGCANIVELDAYKSDMAFHAAEMAFEL